MPARRRQSLPVCILTLVMAAVVPFVPQANGAEKAAAPNIVFILADDKY